MRGGLYGVPTTQTVACWIRWRDEVWGLSGQREGLMREVACARGAVGISKVGPGRRRIGVELELEAEEGTGWCALWVLVVRSMNLTSGGGGGGHGDLVGGVDGGGVGSAKTRKYAGALLPPFHTFFVFLCFLLAGKQGRVSLCRGVFDSVTYMQCGSERKKNPVRRCAGEAHSAENARKTTGRNFTAAAMWQCRSRRLDSTELNSI